MAAHQNPQDHPRLKPIPNPTYLAPELPLQGNAGSTGKYQGWFTTTRGWLVSSSSLHARRQVSFQAQAGAQLLNNY